MLTARAPADVILASSSRFRRVMLEAAGITLRAIRADVDEPALRQQLTEENRSITPGEIALALAHAKATVISAAHPVSIVLGADQVLACDGHIFAKPSDVTEARNHLLKLRNREHTLPTGCVVMRAGQLLWSDVQHPRLVMRDFSDEFLDRYLADVGDRAVETVGAYQIEGLGAQLFSEIEGDYFSIIGLQLLPLMQALRRLGVLDT